MIHAGHCGKLKHFNSTNETEAIKLTWDVPIEKENKKCKDMITGYNITFWTIGRPIESRFIKWNESQTNITVVLENLIPERRYIVMIIVNLTENRIALKRLKYLIAGMGMFN